MRRFSPDALGRPRSTSADGVLTSALGPLVLGFRGGLFVGEDVHGGGELGCTAPVQPTADDRHLRLGLVAVVLVERAVGVFGGHAVEDRAEQRRADLAQHLCGATSGAAGGLVGGHEQERGVDLPGIIVMEHAFHGRTLATLSATGNRKVQAGFEPLTPGFYRVPFSDIDAVRAIAEHNRNVVAVLFEPVQGEGGIHPADLDYLRALRDLCDQHQWLFMVDEVQSGVGRTGSWFAFQHAGVEPDVMTLAKGLGSGVPIGACLARGPAAGVFKPGTHGSTFGGNPLACAAALTTLEVVERDDLRGNAVRQGDAIRAGFRAAFKDDPAVVDIRGVGMMIGVELDRPCGALVAMALEAGVLINVTSDTTIRLVPPLVYTDADSAELVQRLTPIIRNFLAGAQLAA